MSELVATRPASRQRLLWVVLSATLVASVWAVLDDSEPPADAPMPRAGNAFRSSRVMAAVDAAAPEAPLALPQRELRLKTQHDLFASALLTPAPPAAPPPTAPPPPPPPITLPYTFAGRLVTAGGPSVLLNEGAQTHVLALGASLGNFRFERDAGAQIEFIHVPTSEPLMLAAPQ